MSTQSDQIDPQEPVTPAPVAATKATEQDLLRDLKAGIVTAIAVPTVQEKALVCAHFALTAEQDLAVFESLTFVLADVSPHAAQRGKYERAYVVSFSEKDPQVPKTLLNAALLTDGTNVSHIALDTLTVQ